MTEVMDRAPGGDEHDEAGDAGRAPGRRPLAWLLIAVVAVALAAVVVAVAVTSGDDEPVELVVPAGTAERLDAGEVVEVAPPVVHLEPGQTLELENDDSRLHVVGTLRADAGETARQVFDAEGRYVVPTSLRSDGQMTILVEEPDDG